MLKKVGVVVVFNLAGWFGRWCLIVQIRKAGRPSAAKARLKMIRKARFAAWLSAPLGTILFPLAELKVKAI
jgi:hypothetical protein